MSQTYELVTIPTPHYLHPHRTWNTNLRVLGSQYTWITTPLLGETMIHIEFPCDSSTHAYLVRNKSVSFYCLFDTTVTSYDKISW